MAGDARDGTVKEREQTHEFWTRCVICYNTRINNVPQRAQTPWCYVRERFPGGGTGEREEGEEEESELAVSAPS